MTDLFLDPSDAELLQRYRDGDDHAAGLLFTRHHPAAVRLASALAGPSAAEDLASDAFFGVLRAVRGGAGPEFAFRPYLLTSVRNGFYRSSKAASRHELYDDVEAAPIPGHDDGAALREESSLLAEAFATLPERWQAVLWHTTIHDESPEEVARTLGIKANAVSSLALRAREGLRNAYLTAHLGRTDDPECREVRELLPAYDRGRLRPRPLARVETHLERCDGCREAAAMVGGITANLGLVLLPALLGAPGVAAFGGTGTGAAATAVATAGVGATGGVAGGASSSGTAAGSAAGAVGLAGAGVGVVAAAAAVLLVAAAAVGAVLVTRGGDDTPRAAAVGTSPTSPAPRADDAAPDEPADEPADATPSTPPAPQAPLAPLATTVPTTTASTVPTTRPLPEATRPTPTPSPRPEPTPTPEPEPTPTPEPEPVDEDLSITATSTTSGDVRVVTLTVTATRETPQVVLTFPPGFTSGTVEVSGWACEVAGRVVTCAAPAPNPPPITASWSPLEASGFSATVSSPGHTDPDPTDNTVTVG